MQDGRPYNDISLLETADDLYTAEDNAAPACLPSKGFLLTSLSFLYVIFEITYSYFWSL